MSDSCAWNQQESDFEYGIYKTSCNNLHYFAEGNIDENNYKYCPYCGKLIEELQ